MIKELSNNTRKMLISIFLDAMRGNTENALMSIDGLVGASDAKVVDLISLYMLKARIYFLSCDYKQSLQVFTQSIEPILEDVSDEIRSIVLQNRNFVSFFNFEKGASLEFYNLYDHKNVMGYTNYNSRELLSAKENAQENKHYESLHLFWGLLVNSFYSCSWGSFEEISKEMFHECLSLGWLSLSVYYLIHSRDSKLIELLKDKICVLINRNEAEKIINCIICTANLPAHGAVAVNLLASMADYIPDDSVSVVFDYLSRFCGIEKENLMGNDAAISSWKAIQAIGGRLSNKQAMRVVEMAIKHRLWNTKHVHRVELIKAINCIVPRLPKSEYVNLINETIKLVTISKSDLDYLDAINLLCHIAQNANKRIKKKIADKLYPKSATELSVTLARVAKYFDKKITINDKDYIINRIAHGIEKQVQRLKINEEPTKVNNVFFNICHESKDTKEKTIVYGIADSDIKFFSENIGQFNSIQCDKVVDAAIKTLRDKDNLLSNRLILIVMLSSIGEKLSKKNMLQIYEILERYVSGDVPEGIFSFRDSDDPLNPYKINDNKPNELAGFSVYALACLEKSKPGVYGKKIYRLIEKSIVNNDPVIRQWSFAGARELPDITDHLKMGVIWGTGDKNPKTAISAFETLIDMQNVKLDDIHWRLLSLSILNSVSSYDKGVKRIIGLLLKKYEKNIPKEYKRKFSPIVDSLKKDLAFSVRNVFA